MKDVDDYMGTRATLNTDGHTNYASFSNEDDK